MYGGIACGIGGRSGGRAALLLPEALPDDTRVFDVLMSDMWGSKCRVLLYTPMSAAELLPGAPSTVVEVDEFELDRCKADEPYAGIGR